MYIFPRHALLANVLKNMQNKNIFNQNNIFFGGGTAITLLHDEYRESIDIDFLCKPSDYSFIRSYIYDYGIKTLFPCVESEPKIDRYGIRFLSNNIKIEIVCENRVCLTGGMYENSYCGNIFALDETSLIVQKFLANTDRGLDTGSLFKDILDLGHLFTLYPQCFPKAFETASGVYGKSVGNEFSKVFSNLMKLQNRKYIFDFLNIKEEKIITKSLGKIYTKITNRRNIMNTTISWPEEMKKIDNANISFKEQILLLEKRYTNRMTALSDRKNSFLHKIKILAAEAGIDSRTFVKDICSIFYEKTYYGKSHIEIHVTPSDMGLWLEAVEKEIEKQKEFLEPGKDYDIPSFKDYIFSMENERVYDKVDDEESERNSVIIDNFPNYNLGKILDFLEKNSIHLFREIEDEQLIFSSYTLKNFKDPAIDFLITTIEDQEKNLFQGKDFRQIFINSIEGYALPSEEEIKQSGIGQLLCQQGYTFADLVQTETRRHHSQDDIVFVKESSFLNTLRDELFEINDNGNMTLALCGTMSVDDLYKALKKPESQFLFSQETTIGVFDPARGEGGCFGISLEKPVAFSVKDCRILIEDSEMNNFSTLNTALNLGHELFRENHVSFRENHVFVQELNTPSGIPEISVKRALKMK